MLLLYTSLCVISVALLATLEPGRADRQGKLEDGVVGSRDKAYFASKISSLF